MKLYVFRTVPLSIIRNFSLYTQQWYVIQVMQTVCEQEQMLLLTNCLHNLYDIYHCCVYSEKFLMMDRGTVRNT